MKLKEWKHERMGGDFIRVSANWTDRMRRPAHVNVMQATLEPRHSEMKTVIEGDARDVMKTLEGLAVIAWGLGWRPPGLVNQIAETVQQFKP